MQCGYFGGWMAILRNWHKNGGEERGFLKKPAHLADALPYLRDESFASCFQELMCFSPLSLKGALEVMPSRYILYSIEVEATNCC